MEKSRSGRLALALAVTLVIQGCGSVRSVGEDGREEGGRRAVPGGGPVSGTAGRLPALDLDATV